LIEAYGDDSRDKDSEGCLGMAKKKSLITAAVAFASSPLGRRLILQAKEYAARPENQARARALMQQAKEYAARPENQQRIRQVMKPRSSKSPTRKPSFTADTPSYGTPPRT
jgi:hypothetical protein